MRFLWPADFSQLGEAKIDKISFGQGEMVTFSIKKSRYFLENYIFAIQIIENMENEIIETMILLYYTFENEENAYLNFTAKLTIGVTASQKHIQYSVNKVEVSIK